MLNYSYLRSSIQNLKVQLGTLEKIFGRCALSLIHKHIISLHFINVAHAFSNFCSVRLNTLF